MLKLQDGVNSLVSLIQESTTDEALCHDYVKNRGRFECSNSTGWHRLTREDIEFGKINRGAFFIHLQLTNQSLYKHAILCRESVGIYPPNLLTDKEIRNMEVFFFVSEPEDSKVWQPKSGVNLKDLDDTFW